MDREIKAELFAGIDLAGSINRNTGFCVLDKKLKAKTTILHTDEEIIEAIKKTNPSIVAVDAPLCLPRGRKSLEIKSNIHLRECDRELLRMKIKLFPITLGPMRRLTERGIRLKHVFEGIGFEVIEVYPGAAQDMLNVVRKQKGLDKLRKGLVKLGIKGLKDKMNADEFDAVTCALVGKMYVENNYRAVGNPEEGVIIIPRKKHSFWLVLRNH